MNRRESVRAFWSAVALLAVAVSAVAGGKGVAVVKPRAELKWTAGAIPGVSSATVDGDMAKGASRFFLKYAAGLATPVHHHSADHSVTTVSGNLVLVLDGKETPVPPGSYFAFTGQAPHAARCVGSEDCVMFVEARGAWDVVPEAGGKH